MNTLFRALLAAAGFGLTFLPALRSENSNLPARQKILFFSKSSGYQHNAIKLKMKDGRPGYAFAVLREIGEKNNIEFTFSKDGSLFTPEYLAQFDAFCFFTTGDLTQAKSDPRGDGEPPMTPAGKAALLKAVAGGKGFIGVHSATDSFHTVQRKGNPGEKFHYDGDDADDYVKMIGGEFLREGVQQASEPVVIDRKFPGMEAVPEGFAPVEEWYSLKNFAPDLHVLLLVRTAGMTGYAFQRPPYPSTWARMQGKGRVFYTALGHREDIWTNPVFQAVLTGGLNWTLRRVDADVTPNLEQVAPQANTLPPSTRDEKPKN